MGGGEGADEDQIYIIMNHNLTSTSFYMELPFLNVVQELQ